MMSECWGCLFWAWSGKGEDGFCLSRSPRMVDRFGQGRWPRTRSTDWCGDYRNNESNHPYTFISGAQSRRWGFPREKIPPGYVGDTQARESWLRGWDAGQISRRMEDGE